jgi:hypothetical protein
VFFPLFTVAIGLINLVTYFRYEVNNYGSSVDRQRAWLGEADNQKMSIIAVRATAIRMQRSPVSKNLEGLFSMELNQWLMSNRCLKIVVKKQDFER